MSIGGAPTPAGEPKSALWVHVPPPWNVHLERQADILRLAVPGVEVTSGSARRLLHPRARPAVFHLQWLDFRLSHATPAPVAAAVAKLVALLTLLRTTGVGTCWSCHNRIGKGHQRRRLDRALRSLVVLLARVVIVHNAEAAAALSDELPSLLTARVRRNTVHVPLPALGEQHGPARSKEQARRALGIAASLPLLAYLPAARQPDLLDQLSDREGRYALITFRRDATTHDLVATDWGWQYRGRPDDETFGLLMSAADAVVLTDERALASMTLHTAVTLRRPVLSPPAVAVRELHDLGGAVYLDGGLEPESIAACLPRIEEVSCRIDAACLAFEALHADEIVADRLVEAYRRALPRRHARKLDHGSAA